MSTVRGHECIKPHGLAPLVHETHIRDRPSSQNCSCCSAGAIKSASKNQSSIGSGDSRPDGAGKANKEGE